MKKRPTLIHQTSPKRRGFTAFEALAAVAILVVLLALAGQMTGTMLQQRRFVERHRAAVEAKTNLMNIAMALPYEEISADRLENLAAEFTPKRARWEISVTPANQPRAPDEQAEEAQESVLAHAAKRIVIGLGFENSSPGSAPNRPLVAWRYPTDSLPVDPARDGGEAANQ